MAVFAAIESWLRELMSRESALSRFAVKRPIVGSGRAGERVRRSGTTIRCDAVWTVTVACYARTGDVVHPTIANAELITVVETREPHHHFVVYQDGKATLLYETETSSPAELLELLNGFRTPNGPLPYRWERDATGENETLVSLVSLKEVRETRESERPKRKISGAFIKPVLRFFERFRAGG